MSVRAGLGQNENRSVGCGCRHFTLVSVASGICFFVGSEWPLFPATQTTLQSAENGSSESIVINHGNAAYIGFADGGAREYWLEARTGWWPSLLG